MNTHVRDSRSKGCIAKNQQRALIDFLRAMVVSPADANERFHAVFLDDVNTYLGDAPLGRGCSGSLTVRMREVFAHALGVSATGIVIAHNHPSGLCRPSQFDIDATRRLKTVAEALDIKLLDHLIFTQDATYSMRAGGNL